MQNYLVFAMARMTPPFFWGGAEKSNLTLALRLLSSTSIQPIFFGSYTHFYKDKNNLEEYKEYLNLKGIDYEISSNQLLQYQYRGIECVMSAKDSFLDLLEKYLLAMVQKRIVVVTMLEFASEVAALCHSIGLSVYLWVMDTFDAGLKPLELSECLTGVFATSHYVENEVRSRFGIESIVLRPMFHSDWYLTSSQNSRSFLTMINPIPEKGINTFLEIAENMPMLNFLIVDSWRAVSLNLPKNVLHWTCRSDVREIYANTQLLLVPSIWPEAFGRVAVEAGINGIPTIASDGGGLREAVGEGGMLIETYRSTSEWVKAITKMLEPSTYWSYSKLAQQNAYAIQNEDWTSFFVDIVFPS